MTRPRFAYSSTVVARPHLVVGCALGAGTVAVWWLAGVRPFALAPVVAAILVATGVHLATVRLAVGAGRISVAQGPWGRPGRVIPATAVLAARAERLSRAQALGLGVPWHWRTSRLTPRSGTALVLTLTTGEHLRISTPNPAAALAVLNGEAGTP